jgi:predicted dithiol-disulfide oxidoreductase (DUF899 family)
MVVVGNHHKAARQLNVFQRKEGRIRHFWGIELVHGTSDQGQDHRGLDFVNPIFAMFDVTPEGRGDWYTKVSYAF